jgi:hypothetical protein
MGGEVAGWSAPAIAERVGTRRPRSTGVSTPWVCRAGRRVPGVSRHERIDALDQ